MRVLLRYSKTSRFYSDVGQGTDRADCARDFCSITNAEEFVRSRQLRDVTIVLYYENPVCELTLPAASALGPDFYAAESPYC